MLPIVDKPLIQYRWMRRSKRLRQWCSSPIATSMRWRLFRKAYDGAEAGETGSTNSSSCAQYPAAHVRAVCCDPAEALGLGQRCCARRRSSATNIRGAVPDDLIWNRGGPGALKQMADAADATGNALAVQDVPREQTGSTYRRYRSFAGRSARIHGMSKNPAPRGAEHLAVVGRYYWTVAIRHMERTTPGAGGETSSPSHRDPARAEAGALPIVSGHRFDCCTHWPDRSHHPTRWITRAQRCRARDDAERRSTNRCDRPRLIAPRRREG